MISGARGGCDGISVAINGIGVATSQAAIAIPTLEPKLTFRKNPAVLRKRAVSRTALEILKKTGKAFTVPELARLALG